MKFYLKIFLLMAILITITFRILAGVESEKSSQDLGKTKTSTAGLPLNTDETGYIGIQKMTTASFGMFDNSCSILK